MPSKSKIRKEKRRRAHPATKLKISMGTFKDVTRYGYYLMREDRTWRVYETKTGKLIATAYRDGYTATMHTGGGERVRAHNEDDLFLEIRRAHSASLGKTPF